MVSPIQIISRGRRTRLCFSLDDFIQDILSAVTLPRCRGGLQEVRVSGRVSLQSRNATQKYYNVHLDFDYAQRVVTESRSFVYKVSHPHAEGEFNFQEHLAEQLAYLKERVSASPYTSLYTTKIENSSDGTRLVISRAPR